MLCEKFLYMFLIQCRPLNWITDNRISHLLESDIAGPIIFQQYTKKHCLIESFRYCYHCCWLEVILLRGGHCTINSYCHRYNNKDNKNVYSSCNNRSFSSVFFRSEILWFGLNIERLPVTTVAFESQYYKTDYLVITQKTFDCVKKWLRVIFRSSGISYWNQS